MENKVETEHILVFFESITGIDGWQPIERENIPDWLRDQGVIEHLIDGEKAINHNDKTPQYYCAIQVARPRPIGYRDQMRRATVGANGKTESGIQLIS